jgi:hypothetical protein
MPRKESKTSYVLCVDSGGYPESLEIRKVYPVVPDELAAARNYVRVIDETGEDYIYPEKLFVPIEVPRSCSALARRADTSQFPPTIKRSNKPGSPL